MECLPKMLSRDFKLSLTALEKFFIDLTEEEYNDPSREHVKYFRKHLLPRKRQLCEQSTQINRFEPLLPIDQSKADAVKQLDDKAQDILEMKMKEGNFKVKNFILQRLPFRDNRPRKIEPRIHPIQIVQQLAKINEHFPDRIENQAVMRGLIDYLYERKT